MRFADDAGEENFFLLFRPPKRGKDWGFEFEIIGLLTPALSSFWEERGKKPLPYRSQILPITWSWAVAATVAFETKAF